MLAVDACGLGNVRGYEHLHTVFQLAEVTRDGVRLPRCRLAGRRRGGEVGGGGGYDDREKLGARCSRGLGQGGGSGGGDGGG